MRKLAYPIVALLVLTVSARAQDKPPEPEGYRADNYRSPVPATLAGARVLTTEEAEATWRAGKAVFIDVLPRPPKPQNLPEGTIWREKPRLNIPGSVWLPDTGYMANDIITNGGSTYMVLVNHTSEATFDPGANDGAGQDFYGLLLENPELAVPAGGAIGQMLFKATAVDYAMRWDWSTLAGQSDVLPSPPPADHRGARRSAGATSRSTDPSAPEGPRAAPTRPPGRARARKSDRRA